MPAPLHCRAGSGTAAASATPAQGRLQMFSVQEGEVFRDPWEQSPSSLVQASQSWDEQKPSTFLSCESSVSLCTVLPIRTAILSASQPSWAPRFHASANSFHLSSAPPHPCPPALCTCDLVSCQASLPSLLSLRAEVQGVLQALDWAVVFSPCGARDHLAGIPKSCCPWLRVCGDAQDADHRHWEGSGALTGLAGTDPGTVLCVLQHC